MKAAEKKKFSTGARMILELKSERSGGGARNVWPPYLKRFFSFSQT